MRAKTEREAQGKRAQGHLQPRRTMRKAYRENETGIKHLKKDSTRTLKVFT